MTYETILFELEDGLARLTLNRPERLNSFTEQMHEEFADALAKLEAGCGARALLFTGAGRAFCAGQDLADRAPAPDGVAPDLSRSLELHYNPLIRRLSELTMPVVCAVNGVAAGAGVSISLACDVVLAARSARFIQSFATLGLVPDSGGTWVLPRLIGQARALGLALTGDPVGAEQAETWGLIWKCVDDEHLTEEAGALARRLCEGPTKGLVETRRAIRESWALDLATALDAERDRIAVLGRTSDYAEGVSAFIEKRPPRFKGG